MEIDVQKERQESLDEDHQVVQQFWANFDYLNSKARMPKDYEDMQPGAIEPTVILQHFLNHSNNPDEEICVNLEHFRSVCAEMKLETIDSKELRRWIPTSRKRQYLGNEPIRSRIEGRSVRVYRFKN